MHVRYLPSRSQRSQARTGRACTEQPTELKMTDTRGLHSIDDDSGQMVSGAEYEDIGPAPFREAWVNANREKLKGTASGYPQVTDMRSPTGPIGDSVIRARPKPARDEMPETMTWLCGPMLGKESQ